ncbi:15382_t:CDS:2 [Gigaspora margarita]|uniref:15382_t:CDS:1 n=1 Tax=Gigaspora margarita TaxID=4874 RepID=A0ABN7V549_GIGMA|nr:15382_t:CDS:2 [Gigaspora margarita]
MTGLDEDARINSIKNNKLNMQNNVNMNSEIDGCKYIEIKSDEMIYSGDEIVKEKTTRNKLLNVSNDPISNNNGNKASGSRAREMDPVNGFYNKEYCYDKTDVEKNKVNASDFCHNELIVVADALLDIGVKMDA